MLIGFCTPLTLKANITVALFEEFVNVRFAYSLFSGRMIQETDEMLVFALHYTVEGRMICCGKVI